MKVKLLILLLLPFLCLAQIPAYYSSINFTQTGNNLKNQLTTLITNTHTTILPYTATTTTDVWDALSQTDLDTTNSNNLLLIYGYNDTDTDLINDRTRDVNAQCHTSSCNGLWVREHTYARSLGTPNLGFNLAGSDAHHLRAIDSQLNSLRSNRIYDDGTGNAAVLPNGNWYPGDEWKGDIARMMMYMYVRYPTQCLATNIGAGSTSFSTFGDMPNIFLVWNTEDPVSQYELNRNNILNTLQGNRNPFIDNPYLASIIWNGPAANETWGLLTIKQNSLSQIIVYPTITTDYIYISNPNNNNFTYSIYNNIGQNIKTNTTTDKIDISNNSKGLYFIKLTNDDFTNTYKIILK
jgi:endonuclease I